MSKSAKLVELTDDIAKPYLEAWRAQLRHGDRSKKTVGLHAVMRNVAQLKTSYTATSVDRALTEIFQLKSTRVRLQRLHEITEESLGKAMKKFAETMDGSEADMRSSRVLTTSHLEALARCVSKKERNGLLRSCATKGWTATRLRQEVTTLRTRIFIQPRKMARKISAVAGQLVASLHNIENVTLLAAVGKVKVKEKQHAFKELAGAVSDLSKLQQLVIDKKKILAAAAKKMQSSPK